MFKMEKKKSCNYFSRYREAFDKMIPPCMIFQNPLSKFGIRQNLSPFVIF